MNFMQFCHGVPQNLGRDAKCPGFPQVIKIIQIFGNSYEYFEYLEVEESIYRSGRGISQPITRRNRIVRGRERESEGTICGLGRGHHYPNVT
jgi:hypothetical protein